MVYGPFQCLAIIKSNTFVADSEYDEDHELSLSRLQEVLDQLQAGKLFN